MNSGASTMPRKMLAAVDKSDRAADAERALQQPRHAAHHRRQDPPVKQQRGQHAHHEHDRQRLKRQDEIRAGRFEVERQRAAAEIAEHERGARARGRGDRADRIVDGAERLRDERQLDQGQRGEKRDAEADGGLPQRNRAAVLAKRPRDRQEREDAERRLQLQHRFRSPRSMPIMAAAQLQSAMPCASVDAAIDKADRRSATA